MEHITFETLPQAVALLLQEVQNLKTQLSSGNREIEDKPFSADQAADFLDTTKNSVYSLFSRGLISGFKRGKRIYFLKSDLLDYIKSGKRKTYKQLSEEARK
jgi:hypothetical protein